jgi:hypothetical protein
MRGQMCRRESEVLGSFFGRRKGHAGIPRQSGIC